MINTIRKILFYVLYYSGITYILYKIGNRRTVILVYHRVLNLDSNFSFDKSSVSASVNNFGKQMEYLSTTYNVISLEDFLGYHKKKINPPKNSVVITFDDGYKDNYQYAYPALKKYKFPATIFLTTDAVDKKSLFWWDNVAYIINKTKNKGFELKELGRYHLRNKSERLKTIRKICIKLKSLGESKKGILIKKLRYILNVDFPTKETGKKILLSWQEISEMSKNKISFGAHTVSHSILTNLSLDEAESEITESKSRIEKNIGRKIKHFSYPNGYENDFNEDIKKMVKRKGFDCALTYIPGSNHINSDLFELKRIFVKFEDDITMFKSKLVGFDIIPANLYFSIRRMIKTPRG